VDKSLADEFKRINAEQEARIVNWVKPCIERGVDGYYYVCFDKTFGFLSAHDLRIIAGHLDEINAEWDALVQREIGPPPEKTQEKTYG